MGNLTSKMFVFIKKNYILPVQWMTASARLTDLVCMNRLIGECIY